MITLSNISDYNNFREIVVDRLFQKEDSIYPLNEFIASFIIRKDFISLKDFAETNPSSKINVQKWKSLINLLSSEDLQSATTYINSFNLQEYVDPVYLYVGSKTSFRQIFADFIPSAFDALFNYLSAKYITQIGSGKGHAFVIHPSFFTSDFSDFNNSVVSSLDILSRVTADFKTLQSDNEYLFNLLTEKDNFILSLMKKISDLEHQNYITSQITWR